jgi:hypothetical protein
MKKKPSPVSDHWRVGDVVVIHGRHYQVIAGHPDERCHTWTLQHEDGSRYRYAPPLKLQRV